MLLFQRTLFLYLPTNSEVLHRPRLRLSFVVIQCLSYVQKNVIFTFFFLVVFSAFSSRAHTHSHKKSSLSNFFIDFPVRVVCVLLLAAPQVVVGCCCFFYFSIFLRRLWAAFSVSLPFLNCEFELYLFVLYLCGMWYKLIKMYHDAGW